MSRPRICLSVFGTTGDICNSIQSAHEADLFEIRLDLSSDPDLTTIRKATSKPLLFASHGAPDLLQNAVPFADYLDVAGASPPPGWKGRTIVSKHAEEADPDELWKQLSGNHLTKIAMHTFDYEKIAALLAINRRHSQNSLCFATGDAGAFSRILSVFRGAPWIYASQQGRATGDGQFTLQDLIGLYRIRRFADEPAVFGIAGDPVSHSLSPVFHNQEFSDDHLPWIYLPFPCKDVGSLLHHAPQFGICGLSITHPHKEAVLPFLSHRSPEVERLRSCNTLCTKDGEWHGINTDVIGVEEVLRQISEPLESRRVLILGAGGSARAIASVIAGRCRNLVILNRTSEKARSLASECGGESGLLNEFGKYNYDLLFQATSVGMREGDCPVDPELLQPGTTVVDLIYRPAETVLLKKAKSLGCRILNGEPWFYAQAEAQFKWWRLLW